MRKLSTGLFLMVVMIVLQGCVATQPFPNAARAGDTITLALGSAADLDRSKITSVTYIPDDPLDPVGSVDLTANIRALFKLYPDKLSPAWGTSVASFIPMTSGHGAWLNVIAIDLPETLPPGRGSIQIQTTAEYTAYVKNPNDVMFAIEVLPGAGKSNPFRYFGGSPTPEAGDLTALEPVPHYLIKPTFDKSTEFNPPKYAAAEVVLTGTFPDPAANIDAVLRVVPDDMSTTMKGSQKQVSWKRNGDSIYIHFISPTGQMAYFETAVSVYFANPSLAYTSTPSVTIRYFDVDGNEVAGPPVSIRSCDHNAGCI